MAKSFACVAVILGALAAVAEISAFVMDKGGIIRDLMRPPQVAMGPAEIDTPKAACPPDTNAVAEMLCRDRRDGTIRLER